MPQDHERAAAFVRSAAQAFLSNDRCAVVSSNGTRRVELEWEPDTGRFGWRSVTAAGDAIADEPSGGFDGTRVWIDAPAFGCVRERGALTANWLPSLVTTESRQTVWPEGYGPNAVEVLRDLRAGRFQVTEVAGATVHIQFASGRVARVELTAGRFAAVELVRVERPPIVPVRDPSCSSNVPSYSSNVWIRAREGDGGEPPVPFASPASRPKPELPKARAARAAALSWLHASDPKDEQLLRTLAPDDGAS